MFYGWADSAVIADNGCRLLKHESRKPKPDCQKIWTRHAFIGVIGAVTRKSSAGRQALARDWTRHASGVIGAVTRKSSAGRQALTRVCWERNSGSEYVNGAVAALSVDDQHAVSVHNVSGQTAPSS